MEVINKILSELRPDIDFEEEDSLIDGSVLDSFDVVALVSELEDEFDIEITPNYLIPENFNSAKAIYALVQKLQDE